MEIEAGLMPTWIRLQTKTLLAYTGMQSLAESHPIHEWINKAKINRTSKVTHLSPLENILKHFRNTARAIEHIKSYIRPPWWNPTARIIVAESKEMAKQDHEKQVKEWRMGTVHIYTDGSGIDNYIGAAIYNQTLNQSEQQHLGHQSRYNVYAAELWAINMAILDKDKRPLSHMLYIHG